MIYYVGSTCYSFTDLFLFSERVIAGSHLPKTRVWTCHCLTMPPTSPPQRKEKKVLNFRWLCLNFLSSSASFIWFVLIVANIKLLLMERCKDFGIRLFSIWAARHWRGKWKRWKLSSTVDWTVNRHRIISVGLDSCQNAI